jgi:DNA-binding response OmpR family regulator
VVEDDVETASFLHRYLGRRGYEVRVAGSVRDALKKLEEKPCDALVSDINLPDGTGWDIMAKAKLPEKVYALTISGFAQAVVGSASIAAGFKGHLTKPFSPNDLLHLLQAAQRSAGG